MRKGIGGRGGVTTIPRLHDGVSLAQIKRLPLLVCLLFNWRSARLQVVVVEVRYVEGVARGHVTPCVRGSPLAREVLEKVEAP